MRKRKGIKCEQDKFEINKNSGLNCTVFRVRRL